MRVIDSRSGREVQMGELVEYPDGYSWRLLGVEQLSFGVARLTIQLPTNQIALVEGPIRRTHPGYLFMKVAFVPT